MILVQEENASKFEDEASWSPHEFAKQDRKIGTLMQLNHKLALCNVHSMVSMNTINNSDYVGQISIPWKL